MFRLAAVLVCIAAVTGGLTAFTSSGQRAAPAELPDLYVNPVEIQFIDGNGTPVDDSMPGDILFINVTVRNLGPAVSGPFNASFFENGALLETVAVNESIGNNGSSTIGLVWDTSFSLVGECTIAVELVLPDADANQSNNRATRVIRLDPVAPILNLTMDTPFIEFEAGARTGQRAKLTGRVDLLMPFGQTAVVQLTSETDNGWTCAVQPTSLSFDYPLAKAFTAYVMVPQDAQGGVSGNLTIKGMAISSGYAVRAQALSSIGVKPVHGISIECERGYQEIKPGGIARFSLKVTNTGNTVTDYSLAIANLEALEQNGWAVSLSRPNLAGLRPDETRTVDITARSSDEFTIWTSLPSVIIVNATIPAQNGTSRFSYKYPVYAYEKGASTWGDISFGLYGIGVLCLVVYMLMGARRGKLVKGREPGPPV
jgi:hypothetical protein